MLLPVHGSRGYEQDHHQATNSFRNTLAEHLQLPPWTHAITRLFQPHGQTKYQRY
jgi:hypothetical protein